MLATRVIPCLLLRNTGLVKTVKFKAPQYVGDPVNVIRIFNEKEVDELVLLDISATPSQKGPAFEVVAKVASECFMPLAYGGGIRSLDDMRRLFGLGVEKLAINTLAVSDPDFLKRASREFGSQSIIVSVDVKRGIFGSYQIRTHGGQQKTKFDLVDFARKMEANGAGEILLTSIDRDGTMEGYDLELIHTITSAVGIPIIACGGAGNIEHFNQAVSQADASAVAAGSMFVFQGKNRGVLINFPTQEEIKAALP